jgi:ABC-type nitrate/sulfonate/bicarbonate transport system permease component
VVIAPTAAERNPARHEARQRVLVVVLGAVVPVLLLALWQVGTTAGFVDTRFFPAPSDIAVDGWAMVASGELLGHVVATLTVVVIGFVVGGAAGVVLGLVMGTLPVAEALFRPSVTAAYTIPKLGVFPLLLLIFGLGDAPKLVLVGGTVFLLVALATADAAANLPQGMRDVGRSFRAGYVTKLFEIVLPSSMPGIFTSLRLSLGMSLLIVIATEFVAGRQGIGFLIWNSWNLFQPAPMYVGVITSAVVGVVITALVGVVERLCTPWARTVSGRAVI